MFEFDFALRTLGMRLKDRAFIGPEVVQIDLTDRCTSNCIGCWARSPFLRDDDHYDTLDKGTLETEFVLEILPDLAGIGVNHIFLGGGGDPLCHPDMIPILRRIKELGFSVTINTNLLNADRKMIEEMVEIGVDVLIASLWASDAAMYSKLHPNQSEGTFRHIESMLRLVSSAKTLRGVNAPKVKIYNVICSLNYQQIPEMIAHGKSLGVEEVEFSIFDPIPRRTHIFLLQPKHIQWIEEFFQEFKQERAPFVHHELFLRRLHNVDVHKGVYDNGIIESIPCAAGWFYARVTTVGQVHSCLKAHRIGVGNLKEHRFGQIWYGDGQTRFRRNTLQLKYDNPFLQMIGHDIDFALPGCYRICDNLGQNQDVMRRQGALTPLENECLAAMEKAVGEGADNQQLRAIYDDFAGREREPSQPTATMTISTDSTMDEVSPESESKKKSLELTENTDVQIPVNLANIARLPKILKDVQRSSGRKTGALESTFSFAPLATAADRIPEFLANLRPNLSLQKIDILPQTESIQKTLRIFAGGLARHSEPDLLRALGVLCNEALIGPRTFHLDVANGCNTDCAYCWFHSEYSADRADAAKFDAAWKKQRMPMEMFTQLADDLAEVGCKEDVVLSGKGEPLIHPDIDKMVLHLKKLGIFTTLFTNGLALSENVARACIDGGLDLLYVSLSAEDPETFAKLQTKPGAGGFEKIIDNLNRLVSMRKKNGSTLPRIVLVDVLTNRNCDKVVRFAELAAQIGVDHLRYQLAAIEPYNRPLQIDSEQLAALPAAMEKAKAIAKNAGIEVIANIDAQLKSGRGDWSGETYLESGCLAGWAFARAWADGTLSFCCSPKPIGNLNDAPFKKWWYGDQYDRYRLAGKFIGSNRDLKFTDGTPLWNDICRRCPNYEGIGHLESILADLGLS